MEPREACAWIIVGVAVFVVVSHWTAAKTWWKYRNEIDQVADVVAGIRGAP